MSILMNQRQSSAAKRILLEHFHLETMLGQPGRRSCTTNTAANNYHWFSFRHFSFEIKITGGNNWYVFCNLENWFLFTNWICGLFTRTVQISLNQLPCAARHLKWKFFSFESVIYLHSTWIRKRSSVTRNVFLSNFV